jgi:hypothetical protein
MGWGACERALKLPLSERPLRESQGQNRNREIRPSGIAGGPGKRDFVFHDDVRAPRLYPDPAGTLLQCTLNEPNFSSARADVGDPVLCHLRGLTEFPELSPKHHSGGGATCRKSR